MSIQVQKEDRGGNVLGSADAEKGAFMAVGSVNVRFVREFLQQDGIPMVTGDLGGGFGRQIHFDGKDFSVYMKKIATDRSRSLEQEERSYWRRTLDENEQAQSVAQFW